MSHRHLHLHRCNEQGCKETHPASRFDNSDAQAKGWFFQKNGQKWCPKHNPPWVAEWRAKQKDNS